MDLFGMSPEMRWLPQVTHPLKAGDCTVHDSCTVHWAGTNQTGLPRYSLATVYTDAKARFDADKFAGYDGDYENMEDYQAANWRGLKTGQPLPDDR